MKKQKKISKPYWEMTAAELAEATKEFDQPIPFSKTRPLIRKERAVHDRMRRSPYRSIFVTRDADGVWVRLDPDVLRRSTRYAVKHKLTLADVINRGLKGLLASAD